MLRPDRDLHGMIPLRDDNPDDARGRLITVATHRAVRARRSSGNSASGAAVEQAILALRRGRRPLLFGLRAPLHRSRSAPAVPTIATLDVPARRLDAPDRQHAVPVDLRQQCRGRHGSCALRRCSTWLCGTVAVFAQALPAPDSTIPMIGASGAISGVLGAYLLLYPQARVLVAGPARRADRTLVHLPAMLVLGLWFGMQLLRLPAGRIRTRRAVRLRRACRRLRGRHAAGADCSTRRCACGDRAAVALARDDAARILPGAPANRCHPRQGSADQVPLAQSLSKPVQAQSKWGGRRRPLISCRFRSCFDRLDTNGRFGVPGGNT
ncbi:MAG: rhomboid family intramembrane serine protease [Comamonadaceae bacterium]|nr:rhomboid family intramembrane serine protease [Comamonadaceae bacterium]